MANIYQQIKQIVRVTFIGIFSKPESRFVPRKPELNNKSYEDVPIVYKAKPIIQEKLL